SMTTCGPISKYERSSSDAPTITARIGTIHTSDRRSGFFFVTSGSGTAAGTLAGDGGLASVSSVMPDLLLPDQARVETLRGEHRQDDHRSEGHEAGLGLHARQRAEAHHAANQHDDVDIEHRPMADGLDDAKQPRALGPAPARRMLDRRGEQREHADFHQRHDEACDEND